MPLSYPIVQHALGNGLRVAVSEDHSCPSASVHVAYGVGSRDEAPGRTGLAHLLERLMFSGSPNAAPGEHAALMNDCGAVFNAATSADRTVYFQHVPSGAVDLALWLEADRMAGLPAMLTQERLDAERAVIAQERQQLYGRPFGEIGLRLPALVYPAAHPYHHPAIGSGRDLAAATLDDVTAFFAAFYTPANAVLAVAGDVSAEQALAAAERYFGAVPAGTPPVRPPVPALPAGLVLGRDDWVEPVPFGATALGWRLPPDSVTDPGIFACDLALQILAGGEHSRAHHVLVRDSRYAQQVTAQTEPRAAASSLGTITAYATPGAPAGLIEKTLRAELELLAAFGPHPAELDAAQAAAERQTLACLSGLPGRAAALARFALDFGDPQLANALPDRITAITTDQVRRAAASWLHPGSPATATVAPARRAAQEDPR